MTFALFKVPLSVLEQIMRSKCGSRERPKI
jgi:hypothetical protein